MFSAVCGEVAQDQFSEGNPQTRTARDPLDTIRGFVKDGRYVLPDKLPEGF